MEDTWAVWVGLLSFAGDSFLLSNCCLKRWHGTKHAKPGSSFPGADPRHYLPLSVVTTPQQVSFW